MLKIKPSSISKRAVKFGGSVSCGAGAYLFFFIGGFTQNAWWFAPAAGCGASMIYMAKEAFKPDEE